MNDCAGITESRAQIPNRSGLAKEVSEPVLSCVQSTGNVVYAAIESREILLAELCDVVREPRQGDCTDGLLHLLELWSHVLNRTSYGLHRGRQVLDCIIELVSRTERRLHGVAHPLECQLCYATGNSCS